MATHVGTSGVVKVGANSVAEITGFTLNETNDTVEDTSLTDSKKSFYTINKNLAQSFISLFQRL